MTLTRRHFLKLSAAAAATSVLPAGMAAAAQPSGSRKKGLGQSVKSPDWATRLDALQCRWFYSWGPDIPDGKPQGVEFIPMIYRYRGNPAGISTPAAAAKNAGITELLGFNEPDVKNQGDMTLEETLDAWPLLMETGLRLGSPGCVHPDKEWMIGFMAGVEERGLRVDFICVHSYGGPNADALVKRLEKVHQMFGERPVWITEFAVGDWQAKSVEQNRHRPEAVMRFMETILPRLDKLDFVERYAWFPARPASIPLATSALFDADGALTPLGRIYRDA